MAVTSTNTMHLVFMELFGMDTERLINIIFLTCTKDIVSTHSPGIELVCLFLQSVAVVFARENIGDFLTI